MISTQEIQPSDRARRVANVVIILSAVASLTLLYFHDQILVTFFGYRNSWVQEDGGGPIGRLILFIGFVFGVIPVGVLLLRYLRGDLDLPLSLFDAKTANKSIPVTSALESEFRDRLTNLENSISDNSAENAGLTGVEKEALIAGIKSAVLQNLETTLPEELKKRISAESDQEEAMSFIRGVVADARNRLTLELAALSRRGNLNLVIGTMTTAVAVFLLYETATGPLPPPTDIPALVSFYVPRISTAIFVEVFSFFFLRLYRAGLADMKHYHAELLTLDMRMTALESALNRADPSTLSLVVGKLAESDRAKVESIKSASKADNSLDPKLILNIVEAVLKAVKTESKAT